MGEPGGGPGWLVDADAGQADAGGAAEAGPPARADQLKGGWPDWPGGLLIAIACALYVLALLTLLGNAIVIHAIRTERKLRTVSRDGAGPLANL